MPGVAFDSGLFSCYEDYSSCLYGFFCPCCLAGDNSAATHDEGYYSNCFGMCCLSYFFGCCTFPIIRQGILDKYGLKDEGYLMNCLISINPCTGPCSNCQNAREIRHQQTKGGTTVVQVVHAAPSQA